MSSREVVVAGVRFDYLVADDPGSDATCLEFYDSRRPRGLGPAIAVCQVGDPGSSDAYVYMGENASLDLVVVEALLKFSRERLDIPDPAQLFKPSDP